MRDATKSNATALKKRQSMTLDHFLGRSGFDANKVSLVRANKMIEIRKDSLHKQPHLECSANVDISVYF
jgi:hypothetical protein